MAASKLLFHSSIFKGLRLTAGHWPRKGRQRGMVVVGVVVVVDVVVVVVVVVKEVRRVERR